MHPGGPALAAGAAVFYGLKLALVCKKNCGISARPQKHISRLANTSSGMFRVQASTNIGLARSNKVEEDGGRNGKRCWTPEQFSRCAGGEGEKHRAARLNGRYWGQSREGLSNRLRVAATRSVPFPITNSSPATVGPEILAQGRRWPKNVRHRRRTTGIFSWPQHRRPCGQSVRSCAGGGAPPRPVFRDGPRQNRRGLGGWRVALLHQLQLRFKFGQEEIAGRRAHGTFASFSVIR